MVKGFIASIVRDKAESSLFFTLTEPMNRRAGWSSLLAV